ncbi:hypothetical protein AN928_04245 [Pseudomonas aeruginosa]|nr:hypothetical protein AN929_05085 [Pseudomonas aeruginosa]KZM09130.1 hypothetical protein AN928_04245 [Pseudomonas aeruginosa]KZM15776.1 hypothetical protein AN930_04200 [Pseudomonas aeruginosa]PCK56538.1 hypothetical protein A2J14_07965 [Pseudomonas aeruginosa]PCK61453.1 hypothetical protein A2J11_02035 [Pseudomonas aeruginosa]
MPQGLDLIAQREAINPGFTALHAEALTVFAQAQELQFSAAGLAFTVACREDRRFSGISRFAPAKLDTYLIGRRAFRCCAVATQHILELAECDGIASIRIAKIEIETRIIASDGLTDELQALDQTGFA